VEAMLTGGFGRWTIGTPASVVDADGDKIDSVDTTYVNG